MKYDSFSERARAAFQPLADPEPLPVIDSPHVVFWFCITVAAFAGAGLLAWGVAG